MIAMALAVYAALLAVVAPRWLSRPWSERHPRAGALAWHVVMSALLFSVVGAGLIAAHDVWEPAASIIFRAEEAFLHHQYAGASTVGHLWNLSLVVIVALAARLAFVALHARRVTRQHRSGLRSAVAALQSRQSVTSATGTTVVALPEPTAFCVPGRRPMIVISEPAVSALSESELIAVITHEQTHLRRRHSVAAGWSRVVARSFPRWTLANSYAHSIGKLHEMQADDAAAKAVGGPAVAGALLVLSSPAPASAIPMAGGHIRRRGLRLLASDNGKRRALALIAAQILAVGLLPLAMATGPAFAVAGSDHHSSTTSPGPVPHP